MAGHRAGGENSRGEEKISIYWALVRKARGCSLASFSDEKDETGATACSLPAPHNSYLVAPVCVYLMVDWLGKSYMNAVVTARLRPAVFDGLKNSSGGFWFGCVPGGSGALEVMLGLLGYLIVRF